MKIIIQNHSNGVAKLIFNLKMRLTILLIILSLFRINASTYSQNTKISLDVQNFTIEKVFDLIQQKTEFKVFFKASEVNTNRRVSLKVSNRRVEYILNRIFKNTTTSYKIVDKQIVLVKKPVSSNASPIKNPQTALSKPQKGFEIKGQIVDKNGLPVPGATVSIQGTTQGVVTDFDGNFTMRVSVPDVLLVESLGFENQTIAITNKTKTVFNIVLIESVESLGEVVITDGYKKVDRRLFAGVATKLDLEDIKIEGVTDASRLLEGRDAGVVVDNVSGTFGASPRIRIRGNTSLNGNNNPIWVVDGVILEDNVELAQEDLASGDINSLIGSSVAGLNPDDIDSFSILKDASATALYGARAKNGVIVITTKKGKKGGLSVKYNNNFAYRLRPRYTNFNVLNSQQELSVYAELVEKGLIDLTTAQRAESYGVLGQYYNLRRPNNVQIGPNGQISDEFFNRYQTANTDWFKTLFTDFSLQQTHSLNVSGGSDDAVYYFSLSYLDDAGQTIGDEAQRYTTKLSTKFNLSDNFSLATSLTGSFRNQRTPGTNDRSLDPITGEFQREFEINPYSFSLTNSRSVTPYDENGNLEFFRKNYAPFNIIHELRNNYIDIDVTDIAFQTDLNYKITNNLTATSTFNYRKAITQREHIITGISNQAEAFRAGAGDNIIGPINPFLYQDRDNPNRPPYSILPEGGLNVYNENVLDYVYWRNSIAWNSTYKDIHQFTALLGQEIKSTTRQSREYTGIGISYENGYLVNTNPDAIDQLIDNNDQYFNISNFRDRFTGFFFNGGYTYDNRYTINGTLRYDGSNLQGSSPKARYLTNYNISGAWNIDNEDFFNVEWVNFLKLKATYGLSGGRGPLTSASLDLRGGIPLRPQDAETIIQINSLENSDLTFEKLKEFSTGLEFSLFNSRIAGEIGYYKRNSFDLIGTVRTSGVGGEAFKTGNFADLDVEGYEFGLSTVNIKTKNFKWSSNLNVGYNTEEVKNLKFNPRLVDLISPSGSPINGREISALYSTRFAGLNEFGIPTFFDADNNRVTNIDLQNRNDIEKILKYEGPTQPRGAGGFSNTVEYAGFSLSANISFKFDYKIRLNSNFEAAYTDFNSLPGELINRWAVPGDENVTNIPAILDNRIIISQLNGRVNNGLVSARDNAYQLYNSSDLRVVDGSYARMRSIALGYTVPSSYAERLGLSSARIRLQGENLFLLYSDKALNGQDPEFFNSGGAALPVPKTVSLSLNVGF
ncbi:SusC/RagA family TonB-linked outer membrane protein [Aquimarina aquimarini]|uniref:SusC/RagA family TonB-linked outer membrane protein n=1 Tax=Aquimarina aquimarini TaxID=1191734 RepID=UPI00131EEE6C|nr:SusC/RagA family TonB-linked outer membrane protein [Aquimarina aquimarini]